jgi:probable addiction module antidote protein
MPDAKLMDEARLVEFDPSDVLDSDETIEAFLQDAMESGHVGVILSALGDVARAKGMTELAKQAGMSRESLYRALSKDGNPQLSTVMKVLDALGYKLDVKSTAAE